MAISFKNEGKRPGCLLCAQAGAFFTFRMFAPWLIGQNSWRRAEGSMVCCGCPWLDDIKALCGDWARGGCIQEHIERSRGTLIQGWGFGRCDSSCVPVRAVADSGMTPDTFTRRITTGRASWLEAYRCAGFVALM